MIGRYVLSQTLFWILDSVNFRFVQEHFFVIWRKYLGKKVSAKVWYVNSHTAADFIFEYTSEELGALSSEILKF